MSSFDAGIASIISRMKALAQANTFDAFDTQIPTGYATQYQNKAPLPYVLMDFGDKAQAETQNQGIAGTRNDLKWTTVIFEVVAPASDTMRQVKSILRDSFEGWTPTPGWGEMVERYNARYSLNAPEGTEFWPARYASALVYVADIDA
jgi:hypothetical protein